MKDETYCITLVIQDLYRLGAQYVTSLVAKGLAQRGHQVTLLVSAVHSRLSQDRPDLIPFPVPESVRMIRLPHAKASQNILALANYYRSTHPQIVITMSPTYFLASMLASRLIPERPGIINVEHSGGIGMPEDNSKVRTSKGPLQGLRKALDKWCFVNADRILTVSQGVSVALNKTMNVDYPKMAVVYNPVVDEQFENKIKMLPHHPWLLDDSVQVIVAAGAHEPLKGYDILIEAFSVLRQRRRCRLVLFGEGSQSESLKALTHQLGIEDDVSFPGYTNNLPANLRKADMFVVSSHCESFSVVLVEALACGVPVVATNCPSGPPEILAGGKYGILVEPNNPLAMAKGMELVLDGKGILPPLESWKPYTLDRVINRYEAVIKEVVDG
ncbi:glycosyl transferase [Desulfoluna limicola]|uniref:Glycosyl transferase n=1 Tax=Desulfoluna limicola TaxID=2810562 RepID=A0ABN6F244_9BACT|nr:glycosyltransferase [Desulfoluna limicola]BCS95590.1 glycosyl transferase [Desulfoluna limicola]